MSFIGDFALGDTFDTKFCTVQSSGAPTTLSGSPVVSIYNGNSTTESTTGVTLTVDFDARTGLNNLRVVATGANSYTQATNYQAVITTGTVNSVSAVGYVVAEFSLANRVPAIWNANVGKASILGIVDSGTLQSATSTTAVIRSAYSSADTRIVGMTLGITGGTGSDQARVVTAYNNTTKTCTVDAWTTTPDSTSTYILLGTAPSSTTNPPSANVTQWNGTAVATPATAGVAEVNVKNVNNVSASAVTTVNANQGTTQPINFVGTGATARVQVYTGIPKNTALNNFSFLMTDSTNHNPATGLTVTATRSLDGAAFAGCANAVAEVANGWYKINLAATDLNANFVALKFTATGADACNIAIPTSQ